MRIFIWQSDCIAIIAQDAHVARTLVKLLINPDVAKALDREPDFSLPLATGNYKQILIPFFPVNERAKIVNWLRNDERLDSFDSKDLCRLSDMIERGDYQ